MNIFFYFVHNNFIRLIIVEQRILEIKQKYNISDTEKIEKIDIEETNKKINEIRNNTK